MNAHNEVLRHKAIFVFTHPRGGMVARSLLKTPWLTGSLVAVLGGALTLSPEHVAMFLTYSEAILSACAELFFAHVFLYVPK